MPKIFFNGNTFCTNKKGGPGRHLVVEISSGCGTNLCGTSFKVVSAVDEYVPVIDCQSSTAISQLYGLTTFWGGFFSSTQHQERRVRGLLSEAPEKITTIEHERRVFQQTLKEKRGAWGQHAQNSFPSRA